MKKQKSKDVIKLIKEREAKTESQNITFRFSKELAETFKSICEEQNVSPNAVAIELIKAFIEDYK